MGTRTLARLVEGPRGTRVVLSGSVRQQLSRVERLLRGLNKIVPAESGAQRRAHQQAAAWLRNVLALSLGGDVSPETSSAGIERSLPAGDQIDDRPS